MKGEIFIGSVIEDLKEILSKIDIYDIHLKHNKTCPKCGHISYISKNRANSIYCPKCGIMDIIDILKYDYGFNENLQLLMKLRKEGLKNLTVEEETKKLFVAEQHKSISKNNHVVNMTFKNSIPLTENGIKYFKDRCIYDVLKEIDSNKLQIKSNIYNNNETIIYRFVNANVGIQKGISKNLNGKRFVRNLGSVGLFLFPRRNPSSNLLVVEGIEDALSGFLMGYNVICLNSISNINSFVDRAIANKGKGFIYELCLDNDVAGIEAMKRIETIFKNLNVSYNISNLFFQMEKLGLKDLNDLLKHKKEGKEK